MTPPTAPRVSIIIPHLNQLEQLVRCLASIDRQDYPRSHIQIIVVDNGSRISLAPVQIARPEILFLREPTPGPGPARNAGVAAATGDILLFIDADCRAAPGWVSAAVAALRERPDDGLVGGDVRIDFVDPRILTGLEAYEAVFAYRQKMYIRKQNFSGTGNLGMWRPVHARVGPFKGIAFAEDRDWGQRATTMGLRFCYAPDMVVYHPARTDFQGLVAKWRRHISHDWMKNSGNRVPALRWLALAAAVWMSAWVDSWRLLVSPRLHGLSNRIRGLSILWRIRAFRAREMLRVLKTGAGGASLEWNRIA
ncbi:glycosyltransferase [Sandaracinobacteroides saxicola]|uniref:Glycosyltransferase family 2 protein n=1 Tax=Sandaracinobacteroides saxicola TaxID=2759707 RepID=A0A7G5IFC7_9SPHN|nr:glycosyltransferase family 2 protein [Sandaracinobacteroides saxicola]QMW22069.1 glycosyltransferase family 2 protein [Sandaracinobacteroides saxicola]